MWFGDLVTMRWFNDVWMKEVFANFMAAKIVNPSFPEINHELRFLYANYPAAYDVDRTPGTNAIRQPLDNLDEAGSLYGAIIYQKAPIVMRQLEGILGEDVVPRRPARVPARPRVRQRDLARSDRPARSRARPRTSRPGATPGSKRRDGPTITTELQVADGRITRLAFAQRDPCPRADLTGLSGCRSSSRRLRASACCRSGCRRPPRKCRRQRAAGARLRAADRRRHRLRRISRSTTRSRAYLLAHLPEIQDPLTRGAAWVTLWEQMLDGRVAPAAIIDARAARAAARRRTS